MAIRPNIIRNQFEAECILFEIKIDMTLLRLLKTDNTEYVISAPDKLTTTHFKFIKNEYINAGWNDLTFNIELNKLTFVK